MWDRTRELGRPVAAYSPSIFWACLIRARSPCLNAGSFFRAPTWCVIATRITSDTGWSSTVATVSSSAACSAVSRIVMAFILFMMIACLDTTVHVKYRATVVSRHRFHGDIYRDQF